MSVSCEAYNNEIHKNRAQLIATVFVFLSWLILGAAVVCPFVPSWEVVDMIVQVEGKFRPIMGLYESFVTRSQYLF